MKTINLCGTWKLRGSNGERGAIREWPNDQPHLPSYDAPVPGTVQEAMEEFTGNVLYAHNCYNARFIEESFWNYSRYFNVDEADIGKNFRIVFDGLDLTADIYINGKKVGNHNNYYTPCKLDISNYVVAGENRVNVIIESGLFYSANKDTSDTFIGASHQIAKRVWLRKPQSSFEWDWSPRLINVGIYKPCRIEISDGIFADETKLFARISDDYKSGMLDMTQYLTSLKAGTEYTVKAEVLETGASGEVSGVSESVGSLAIPIKIEVPNPELWYPRNYGAQKLYTVKITVNTGDNEIKILKKTGFRKAVIDQSEHPIEGKYFILQVNGINVFAKGGNMVPADILCSRFTRDVYEVLISRAVEANMNALRVWGGGLYENDDFYELCDEYGIVVWQDFIGACANYPGDDKIWFNNYVDEIVHTIRRLSCHPSLVIYSGNNEIDWQMQAMLNVRRYPDAQLYYWILPKKLAAEGEDRYYQPSSPYSDPKDHTDANIDIVGDQHPWSIGFADREYFKYRNMVCRFPNEGGILGPTSLPNMMACFGEGQDYIHSFDWQVHDNTIAFPYSSTPDRMTEEKLNLSIKDMNIADYVYYGGFCQGEGLTEYILNFRRRMYSSASAIFWMYNDCWPATRSWTVVDYLRNRTPSFQPVKRANAPVTVDIVKNSDSYTVYAISERLKEKKAVLEYGAFTVDGQYITETKEIVIPENASYAAAVIENIPEGYIPYAILKAEDEPVARRRFVECAYSNLGLKPANITCEINDGVATYTADKLVLGVCLDLNGEDGDLGDNFFDLYPGKPYSVKLGGLSGEILYSYQGQTAVK
ncbi:MAG: hypothetical protein IJA85_11425 [Clostridia bacterium]|nr:hypothetical protein [Clostridia bacterium]